MSIIREKLYTINNLRVNAGRKEILSINELFFEKSSIHLIKGPNGSGKTTLMKVMNNLISVKPGSVFYKGEDIILNKNKIRFETVYLHQTPFPLSGTVRDNIAYGLRMRKISKDLIEVLVEKTAGLLKISHLLDKNAGRLSGGELQKTAIARAAVLDCEVYFFDEPVSSVDAGSADIIRELITDLVRNKNKTVIYSTHQSFSGDFLADNIIEL